MGTAEVAIEFIEKVIANWKKPILNGEVGLIGETAQKKKWRLIGKEGPKEKPSPKRGNGFETDDVNDDETAYDEEWIRLMDRNQTPFEIQQWLKEFQGTLCSEFGSRLFFMGIQGSYARKEAQASSDIDVVVILDELAFSDLERYQKILDASPFREKICGFISGKDELVSWEKSDLFQLYYDTESILGSLDFLRPLIQLEDVKRAVLIGACNLYHACCHNFLHEKDFVILKALYKTSAFVLRAKYFCETGIYVRNHRDLLVKLTGKDREILELSLHFNDSLESHRESFADLSERIASWSGNLIKIYG